MSVIRESIFSTFISAVVILVIIVDVSGVVEFHGGFVLLFFSFHFSLMTNVEF